MSFTTPTVDVYVPGTTLGIGNVNAGTINIGKTNSQINIGGTTTFTNSVDTPTCTMGSLSTGNLIISPFAENVRFSNLSATNANVTNMSATNASFYSVTSNNILIGPYPQNGTYNSINVTNPNITNLNSTIVNSTNLNALNASITNVNVSGFLISPLTANPTFASVTTGRIIAPNIEGSGTGTITIGNSTNSVALNGAISIGTGKNITLQPSTSYDTPTAFTMLGGTHTTSFTSVAITNGVSPGSGISVIASKQVTSTGVYLISWTIQYQGTPTTFYTNVANTTTSVLASPRIAVSNWGNATLGTPGGQPFTSSSGSSVISVTNNNYLNLIMFFLGTGGLTTDCGFLSITRIA